MILLQKTKHMVSISKYSSKIVYLHSSFGITIYTRCKYIQNIEITTLILLRNIVDKTYLFKRCWLIILMSTVLSNSAKYANFRTIIIIILLIKTSGVIVSFQDNVTKILSIPDVCEISYQSVCDITNLIQIYEFNIAAT